MTKDFDLSLFIFRRDLRLQDNTGLIKALERSKLVIPCFIFDPSILENKNSNSNALQFMIQSLQELQAQFSSIDKKLYFFHGEPYKIIEQINEEIKFDAVFVNKDYSRYSKKRDKKILEYCKHQGIEFLFYSDYILSNPESIYTGSGNRYQVFTYFYKKAMKIDVKPPKQNNHKNYFNQHIDCSIKNAIEMFKPPPNPNLFVKGGRSRAIEIIDNLENYKEYDDTRELPALESGTTHLAAYLKFGVISIREVYNKLKNLFGRDHSLIRQLYWRDFYVYLAIHFNHVFTGAFKRKYNRIKWKNDKEKFERWCQGKTGFPIVDAGMRQLNETGYMHNRIRMVVASFLVKDLHINWQWGERYFAKKLVDYDVMVNNGNWQWAASTGADAQPYFRIFNPWSQQRKYDPKAEYIKRYVKELSTLNAKTIHKLEKNRPIELIDYPPPVIDHKQRSNEAKELFKSIS